MRLSEPAKKVLEIRKGEAYRLHDAGLNNKQVSLFLKDHMNFTRTEQWVSTSVKWWKENKLSTGE